MSYLMREVIDADVDHMLFAIVNAVGARSVD